MCGIHGFTGPADRKRLFRMAAASAMRGPDGLGTFDDDRLSLAQNLLAIMDLPVNSAQPWRASSGELLCFNGEIYNYRELRRELAARGVTFATDSDTEVLAEGLARDGEAFLSRLDGMYAIAFYSPVNASLLLARDSIGAKPLYYAERDGRLVFSSQFSGVLDWLEDRRLDRLAATLYFQLGYVPGPRTLVSGLNKMTPGEWRRYSLPEARLTRRGAVGREAAPPQAYDPRQFTRRLRASVGECLQGLRPTGIYLSGGMDSSMVLHEARELGADLFSISTRFVGGEDLAPFNEDADLAARLAAAYGVEHHEARVTENDFADAVEATIDVLQEPRYNRSSPAYLLTARAMAEQGAVVTLSGDAGDELLGGYPKYGKFVQLDAAGIFEAAADERARILSELKWAWAIPTELDPNSPSARWYYFSKFRLEERGYTQGVREPASLTEILAYLADFLGSAGEGDDKLNSLLMLDQLTWLPEDALIRNDRFGMAFGMEGRFPLLSRPFRDYAMGLPGSIKIVDGRLKRLARKSYAQALPDFIAHRRRKTGWAAPVLVWQEGKGRMRDLLTETLSGSDLGGLIDVAGIQASKEPKLLYAAFYLAVWARRYGIAA